MFQITLASPDFLSLTSVSRPAKFDRNDPARRNNRVYAKETTFGAVKGAADDGGIMQVQNVSDYSLSGYPRRV